MADPHDPREPPPLPAVPPPLPAAPPPLPATLPPFAPATLPPSLRRYRRVRDSLRHVGRKALQIRWSRLSWKGKAFACCVAYLALNLAVVLYGTLCQRPAKPETASDPKMVAERPAKLDVPSDAAPTALPQTVVELPAKDAAYSPETLQPTKAEAPPAGQPPREKVLPAIHNWTLDGSHALATGDVGRIACERAMVEKIIDGRSCIVRTYTLRGTGQPAVSVHSLSGFADDMQTQGRRRQLWRGMAVQLKGWSTAGKVTGEAEDLSQTLFRVTGTSNQKTADAGSVTVYDLEVVNPLVAGNVVRLPSASGEASAINRSEDWCIVRPYGPEGSVNIRANILTDDAEFLPVLIKGLPLSEIKAGDNVRLDQTLFRVTGKVAATQLAWGPVHVYILEVVKPPPK